jgi:hypothetical protein
VDVLRVQHPRYRPVWRAVQVTTKPQVKAETMWTVKIVMRAPLPSGSSRHNFVLRGRCARAIHSYVDIARQSYVDSTLLMSTVDHQT